MRTETDIITTSLVENWPRAARRKLGVSHRQKAFLQRIRAAKHLSSSRAFILHNGHAMSRATPPHVSILYRLSISSLCHGPRPQRPRASERENSATGHIGFLEFINAAALPFAREPCNINGKAILASIASSVERVHAATGIHPPSQPTRYPSTHDQLDTRERVKRAFAASH